MLVYLRGQGDRLIKIDFIRFCIVGTLGFVINFVLLTLLYKVLGIHVFIAQLISSEVALFSNFILHHNWTYKHKVTKKTVKNLLIQFHMSSWTAIIGSALIVAGGVRLLHMHYLAALIIASAVGLVWNFAWTKFVIWRHHHEGVAGEASS